MGKSSGGGPSITLERRREEIKRAIDAGEFKLVSITELAAKSNGSIKVGLKSSEYPDFTEAVNRGAALLDRELPGWWRAIDTSALDLDDENHCVLGQSWSLYNDLKQLHMRVDTAKLKDNWDAPANSNFQRLLSRLWPGRSIASLRVSEAASHGFAFSPAVYHWINVEADRRIAGGAPRLLPDGRHQGWAVNDELWEHLTKTWLVLIEARQKADADIRERLKAVIGSKSTDELADELMRRGIDHTAFASPDAEPPKMPPF